MEKNSGTYACRNMGIVAVGGYMNITVVMVTGIISVGRNKRVKILDQNDARHRNGGDSSG